MYDRITPVNKALLIANFGIFLLQQLYGPLLMDHFALWPPLSAIYGDNFRIWQLLTHGFLHFDWIHLFFNMFALYMFGSRIEALFGSRRYLIYYLVCVVGAAVAYLIVQEVANLPPAMAVGASGGVYGLLLAFGMAWPREKLMLLFPPIPMPAWLFVTLYGVAELWLGITGTVQGVGHFAHLGGMATGFVLFEYWKKRLPPR